MGKIYFVVHHVNGIVFDFNKELFVVDTDVMPGFMVCYTDNRRKVLAIFNNKSIDYVERVEE